jgi:UDP-glucose 4-epimerase
MASNAAARILVTGGMGYIGSHACVALLDAGYDVVILDDLSNSKPSVLGRIATIAGKTPDFVRGDVRDPATVQRVLAGVHAVIHFAGLKAVGESVAEPLRYYDTNVGGSLVLLDAMRRCGVRTLVFSSSATVYGDPDVVPIPEDAPLRPASPYGRSKRMVEDALRDLVASDPSWKVGILRYFNPIGAHERGVLGEDPNGIPNNLLPHVAQVAAGRRPEVTVFGADYPTPDGTGVRDYVHVVDLAEGHVATLGALGAGVTTLNLGTGRGYSVLEVIAAFEAACGRTIPYRMAPRRPGDVPAYWADPSLARRVLGWQASRGLDAMCADAWRWQQFVESNP